jgi:hypothetical protein
MKNKHLYLFFAVFSIICIFTLAASCNMCGLTIAKETEEEAAEELAESAEEESSSLVSETQSGDSQSDIQTQDQSGNEEVADADTQDENNHDPIITNVAADDVELDLSDEFRILVGENADFLVRAEDQDDDELAYFISDSNGNNMETERVDNNTVRFGWVAPSDPGLYEIYIEVSDGNGGDDSATVRVTVNPWGVAGGDDEEDEGEAGPSLSVRGFGANASISGQVNEDGVVFISSDSSGAPSIYVGDTATDLQVRGFISFDVSGISGKNVQGAWLTIRGSRTGNPTSLSREMRIGSIDFGNSLNGTDYGVSSNTLTSFFPLDETDFSFTNEELRNAVQSILTAGRQNFQIKMAVDSVSNNHVPDGFTFYLSDIALEVEYE